MECRAHTEKQCLCALKYAKNSVLAIALVLVAVLKRTYFYSLTVCG